VQTGECVSFIIFVQEEDGDVEDPSDWWHPSSGSSQLGNGVIGSNNGSDLEDAVAVHKVQVGSGERQKEVGPVQWLEGRL